jgi:hypothetical protein
LNEWLTPTDRKAPRAYAVRNASLAVTKGMIIAASGRTAKTGNMAREFRAEILGVE